MLTIRMLKRSYLVSTCDVMEMENEVGFDDVWEGRLTGGDRT